MAPRQPDLAEGGEHSIDWPPGTILLQDVETNIHDSKIILVPHPSDDPNDPLNWPRWYKYLNFGFVAWYTFLIFAFTCIYTPLWSGINSELGIGYDRLNTTYATNNVFLGVGAFFTIPFVLKYGRRPVYLVSLVAQFGISIWYARMESYGELMAINIVSCTIGAVAEVIVQLTVADMFFVHERGVINTIYAWTFNAGGTIMPTVAGQLATYADWRWVWWMMAIIFGVSIPAYALFYEETKYTHPITEGIEAVTPNTAPSGPTNETNLERQKSDAFQMVKTQTGQAEDFQILQGDITNQLNHSGIHINRNIPRKTFRQRLNLTTTTHGPISPFLRHMWQPLYALFKIPAVFYMAALWGTTMAWMTTMLSTLSAALPAAPYNFTPGDVGLMSIAACIGYSIGSISSGLFADRLIKRLAARNAGVYEPEMRLWILVPFIPLLPGGTILYAVCLAKKAHWATLAAGAVILNAGVAPLNALSLTYLTDSYPEIIGDALVALTLPRYIIAAALIYAVNPWVAAMGTIWTFVLISILGTIILMGIFVFIKWGKTFRVKTRATYAWLSRHQYQSRPQ
ncbi:MFS general substrate transporter [Aspergillus insuetus]